MRLEAILDYGMDPLEAKAYKICLLWLDKSRKIFPEYKHTGMRKGDPRKSLIFKVCFTLARKTEGLLDEKDYALYVRAQLEILKHINVNNSHPLIDVQCLLGDKAWKRWKLWKRRYDAVTQKPSEVSQPVGPGEEKALLGFEQTKDFLTKTLGAAPGLEKYRECVINKNLFRWINLGKISPYYVAVSPHIAAVVSHEDLKRCNFDPGVYKPCITERVMQRFKELFSHEF